MRRFDTEPEKKAPPNPHTAGFFEVVGSNGFAGLRVHLKKGEQFKAESDALVSKSEHVTTTATMDGGCTRACCRMLCLGESLYLQVHRAEGRFCTDDEEVLVAPKLPGAIEIIQLPLNGSRRINIVSGSFLAADSQVELTSQSQCNFSKAMCSGQGLFYIQASGPGLLAINSYGSIVKYTLGTMETRVVDTSHVVAWDDSLAYCVQLAGNSMSRAIKTGEGMVCKFVGPGELYVQTHATMMRQRRGAGAQQNNPVAVLIAVILIIITFVGAIIISLGFDTLIDHFDQGY